MNSRLRLRLHYKDGTQNEVVIQIPIAMGEAIQGKGLLAAQVFVDEYVESFPSMSHLEDFQTKKGG